jgi:uncharacterized membrane protein
MSGRGIRVNIGQNDNRDETIHPLSDIGLIGKAVDGVLEIIGGALLLFVDPGQINGLMRILTRRELSEDHHDIIANFFMHTVQHLTNATLAFGLFLVYQLYRYSHTHSVWLLALPFLIFSLLYSPGLSTSVCAFLQTCAEYIRFGFGIKSRLLT